MKRSNEEVRSRRDELLDILIELKTTDVKTLSDKLQVSEMTIRRDCAVLSRMGQIKQTFGKVELTEEDPNDYLEAIDPIEKIKDTLAKEAASYVKDGDTLFINTSSTAFSSLHYLKERVINVLTNNTHVVEIEHNPKSLIMLSGGEVRYPKAALFGDIAVDTFSSMRSDISIIGCSGLSLENGITTSVIHEARVNEKLVQNSGSLIVVADYRKIGKSANYTIGDLKDISLLITDNYANPKIIEEFEAQGVKVIQMTT